MADGMRVWRLSKQKYAPQAFSGEGPRIYGGRWNPVGVPLVYASLSLSLAVLEVFVHMPKAAEPEDYVSVMAELPVRTLLMERINVEDLPRNWKHVNNPATQTIGAEWVRSKQSPVLLVPSVIIEGEWNALINPEHPDASKTTIAKMKPFWFDARMFR